MVGILTTDFQFNRITTPEGYLTADVAQQFDSFTISFSQTYGIALKMRNELRSKSVIYAKKILHESCHRSSLSFGIYFFEKFEGIGWRSRFQRKLLEMKKTEGNKIIHQSKTAEAGKISWLDEVNEASLSIANGKHCIGVIYSDLNKFARDWSVVDSISENGLSGAIQAESLSDNIFSRIYHVPCIAGFFVFLGISMTLGVIF